MDKTSRTQSNYLKNNWGTIFKGLGLPAAGALAAYVLLQAASSRGLTKHQIIPFKGNRLSTLAFATYSAAVFALGHTLTGPYRSSIEPPPNPENDNTPSEDLKEREEGEGRGSFSSIQPGLGQDGDHELRKEDKLGEGGAGSTHSISPPLRENKLADELRGEDFENEDYLLGIGLTDDKEENPEMGEGQSNGSQQPPLSVLSAQSISSSSMPETPPLYPFDERSIGDGERSNLGQGQEGKDTLLGSPEIQTVNPHFEDGNITLPPPQMFPQTTTPPVERSISEDGEESSDLGPTQKDERSLEGSSEIRTMEDEDEDDGRGLPPPDMAGGMILDQHPNFSCPPSPKLGEVQTFKDWIGGGAR